MKKFLVIIFVFIMMFGFVGCVGVAEPGSLEKQMQNESKKSGENQSSLITSQPAPVLKWSNERDNIIKRVTRFNDPNKIGYIYLFSLSGEPIAYSAVKGKVSCISSYCVPDENVVDGEKIIKRDGEGACPIIVQQPDVDGSYGTNGEGVFWFDENDIMWQWSGQYLYTDQPVKIFSVPRMGK